MKWILAFHIISVVCWFAGLFYLPRLFVYHTQTKDELGNERFKVMERRLYKAIMHPAMIATVLFGCILLFHRHHYYWEQLWMHIKLGLVGTLIIYHFWCGRIVKQFKEDANQHSEKFYRFFNEYPTIILITVVILTVVR